MLTRRLAGVLALTLTGLGGFAASAATGPSTKDPVPVQRVQRYYGTGPSADYSGDSGGIGQVRPLRFAVPEGATSTGVVEVSFQYRTKGKGPFVVHAGLEQVGGGDLVSRPDELALAPAPEPTSTTVRFLTPDIEGGHTYRVFVGVNSFFTSAGAGNHISTRRMVVTVELSTD